MLVAWLMTPGMSFLPGGSFDALPHRPLVLVARVGLLDAVGADLHLQQQVDDVLQRHVEGVRAVPASPADVIARALLGDAAQRMVERVDAKLRPGAVLRLAHRRHHPLVHVGQEGVVDLHIKAGIDDRLVFLVQAVGEREQQAPSRRRSARSWRRAARSPAPPPAGTRRRRWPWRPPP